MKKLILFLLQILFISLPLFAQNESSKSNDIKIALIAKIAFEIKPNGVERVIRAYEVMDIGSGHCYSSERFQINKTLEIVEKELNDQTISLQIRQEKQKKREELKSREQFLEQECQKGYQWLFNKIVQPILDDAEVALNLIAKQNNTIILDGGELEYNGQLLAFNRKIDATNTIIPLINDYFKTGGKANLKLNLPESKIAFINTKLFADENSGVKQIFRANKELDEQMTKDLVNNPTDEELKLWSEKFKFGKKTRAFTIPIKEIQVFADEKGFDIVLDSSKTIPAELKNIPIQDITKDFISYYNQLNP